MESLLRNTASALEMIKWEHSVFALPFALAAAFLAANGLPTSREVIWIVVCMVSARSAGMAFNRVVDATFDAANPRTQMRALATGELQTSSAIFFVVITSAVFLAASSMLNRLTLELAPVALTIILGYSYTKRVTRWSHLVLGLALGVAPSAAWIAVRGSYDLRILILTGLVMSWVAGFDVLYSCQDTDHDRRVGLKSIPAAYGVENAFRIARGMHITMLALAIEMDHVFHLRGVGYLGTALVAALLYYEHSIISPHDLRRMNAAFFLLNGYISVVFFFFVAIAIFATR